MRMINTRRNFNLDYASRILKNFAAEDITIFAYIFLAAVPMGGVNESLHVDRDLLLLTLQMLCKCKSYPIPFDLLTFVAMQIQLRNQCSGK